MPYLAQKTRSLSSSTATPSANSMWQVSQVGRLLEGLVDRKTPLKDLTSDLCRSGEPHPSDWSVARLDRRAGGVVDELDAHAPKQPDGRPLCPDGSGGPMHNAHPTTGRAPSDRTEVRRGSA